MEIAIIAHDLKMELMTQFCIAYCGILSKHNLCATSVTAKYISEATGLEIERLLGALSEIKRLYGKSPVGLYDHEYIDPILEMSPQAAFYADQETLPIAETAGRVCSEFVMCYPPGIPILAPGERITQDILDYIAFAKEKGCSLTGCRDMNVDYLQVVK